MKTITTDILKSLDAIHNLPVKWDTLDEVFKKDLGRPSDNGAPLFDRFLEEGYVRYKYGICQGIVHIILTVEAKSSCLLTNTA